MSPLLSLRGLTRTFQVPHAPDLHILTGVDLDVEPGEHIAIVGRSGTGKSTLLNILGLIDQPTSGTYTLEDQDATRLSEGRRARLRGATFGFVFQSFNLIEGLSTTENVAAPLLYDTGRSFWTRTARAGELLDAVGLGDKVDSPIGLLSGGEQQRVAIARAIARRPRVILADEPTGALDVDTGTAVMELLEAQCAQRGAALIIITHDLAVAARASTQYRLDHGVLTPITVTRHRVGTLEEFGEAVAPSSAPAPSPSAASSPSPQSASSAQSGPVTPLSAPTPAPAPTPVPRPDASTPASGGPHPTTDGPQPTTQDLQDTQKIGVVP